MRRTSAISLSAIAKLFWQHARHPWIGRRLAELQCEKWLFNAFGPGGSGGQANKIRQFSLRITDVCNLRCVMCGQWGESGFLLSRDVAELKRDEVSPGRYIELLDDMKAHGHTPTVYLWGGEPMLYPGTLDIVRHAARLGMPPSIATNGTRMSPEAIDTFIQAPMFLMQVSIDGHNSAVHNAIRRSPSGADTFGEVMAGLTAMNEARRKRGRGLPVIASLTTISGGNHRHLTDIYDAISPHVDLLVFYLSWWIDEADAVRHEEDFARRFGQKPVLHRGWIGGWKPTDYAQIDAQLSELRRRSARFGSAPVVVIPNISGVAELGEYYTNHGNTFGFDRCISIHQAVEIDSNGDMSPCRDYHDYVVGNVKEHTVPELWNSGRYRAFRQSLASQGLMPACTRCCGLMGY